MDDGYRVRIPLPGIAPENVTLDVTGRTIHVRAIERDGDTELTRYEEVLTLPASVDAERVRATLRHGLLELALPYHDALKPRRIEIETEQPKQFNRWVGAGADYRTFFVHRDESTPRVHRFSTGLTFSLK